MFTCIVLPLPPMTHARAHALLYADFEMQVSALEAIFRLTSAEDRESIARHCFRYSSIVSLFLEIKESSFESVSHAADFQHYSFSFSAIGLVVSFP